MPEVIEIVSSDDEEQDCKFQPGNGVQESKEAPQESDSERRPEANSDTITLSAPNLILQARRLRIDSIFNEYGRCHNLLLNLQHLMNTEQQQRWRSHLDSKDKPIYVDQSEDTDLPPPGDTYQYDRSPARDSYQYDRSPPRYEPYRPQSGAAAGYVRRRPPARRKAPKRRRASAKRSPVKRRSVTSRTQSSTTSRPSTSRSQTTGARASRPSTSAGSSVKVERTRVKLQPRISVKKERVN